MSFAMIAPAPPPSPSPPLISHRASQYVAGGTSTYPSYNQSRERERDDYHDRAGTDRQIEYRQTETNGTRGPTFVAQSTDPDYATFEEGEAAFMKLLRRSNVQPDWTWEQAMRATIKDPQYRALKDPKDRKAAFEKYAVEVRAQEKDRAKERLAKLRADFGVMLRRHPEIKHYTHWKTARPIIERETIFRSTDDEDERRQLFEEYVVELRKVHAEHEAASRKSAMDELVAILKALDLEPYTRWSEVQSIIQSNERFAEDEKFRTLTKSDILTAFENHIKALERSFNDQRQREKTAKVRKERQNRDRFLALLQELRAQGKIKAGTKWMHIFPEVESDPRYGAMLGQAGSTPLDLFWDVVEEEEGALRLVRNDVYDVLEDRRYEVTPKTTYEEFAHIMSTDRRTSGISPESLGLIFDRLMEKVVRRSESDKHESERQQRRLVDALRSKIRHLDNPPVTPSSTWESVRSQISSTEEYKALESDDLRRQAFDKVIRRLERDEEAEREREKDRIARREQRERERDRERERERDPRNGHPDRDRRRDGRSRLSKTPEPDAYEADRRKAMADRERQYRKSSGMGLSTPPRERDRHDRVPARLAEGRLGGYDRRDREEERERLYRARGDPRGSRDELDYGSGSRRRRDSDGESVASRKRPKRDEDRSPGRLKARPDPVEAKEEPGVHSGSEEGEMVED
jgi:pre-mRNA-processing factor 40